MEMELPYGDPRSRAGRARQGLSREQDWRGRPIPGALLLTHGFGLFGGSSGGPRDAPAAGASPYLGERAVRAVAQGCRASLLADAKPQLPGLGGSVFQRRELAALVRAIAKGLRGAAAAAAPPIGLAGLDLDRYRLERHDGHQSSLIRVRTAPTQHSPAGIEHRARGGGAIIPDCLGAWRGQDQRRVRLKQLYTAIR